MTVMYNDIDADTHVEDANKSKYVMLRLANQLFGILVTDIEDILSPRVISPVPLAPPEVMGVLNLRGRIVTAINLRAKLEMAESAAEAEYRSVVVSYQGELYSLIVDQVSEVMSIDKKKIAHIPENLSEVWKSVSDGVYSMQKELMVILNVNKLLHMSQEDKPEGEI